MRNRLLPLLRRPAALDAGLAALLGALSVLAVWSLLAPGAPAGTKLGYEYGSPELLHWRAVGWLAVVGAELAVLPARRRFPATILAVTLGLATVHSALLPVTPAPADLAVAAAVYTVAAARPRPVSAAATAASALSRPVPMVAASSVSRPAASSSAAAVAAAHTGRGRAAATV